MTISVTVVIVYVLVFFVVGCGLIYVELNTDFCSLTSTVIILQLGAHITPPSNSSTLGVALAEGYSSTLHVTQPRTVFLPSANTSRS